MRPHGSIATAVAGLALLAAGCGRGGDDVTFSVRAPSGPVKGNVVELDAAVDGVSIVTADGDTSGTTGHYHVFIDRKPVTAGAIPKEKGIVHAASSPIKLYGLAVGKHRLTVVLGDGAHQRIQPDVEETVEVEVLGPSLQATATPPAKPGDPTLVSVKVEGFRVVPADGDNSGATGHLHVFVDREPTPVGQSIPKEPGIIHTTETSISVPGLAPGEHTLWVVAADGNHVRFDPPVMAKLTITL